MPLTLVTGSYKIVGASPDGDSVRFYPEDPSVWARAGIVVKANAGGGVQLRLDAVDALETHYTPPQAFSPWRQPAELGGGAAAALLDLLGFTDVVRDDRGSVTSATPTETSGYILTRFADKYGRAVAMAFPGTRSGDAADGSAVYLDVAGTARVGQLPAARGGLGVPDVLLQALRGPARRPGRRRGRGPRRPTGGSGTSTPRCPGSP